MADHKVIQLSEHAWRIDDDTVRLFLFEGEERALLVDSGKLIDNAKEIVSSLTAKPIILVNTHTDGDHIACNHQFEQIYMSPAEFPMYYKAQKRKGVVNPLWHGDVIELGGWAFEIIFTPGHTCGSISLLDRKNRILVGGDGIQDGRIFLFGPYRELLAYKYSLELLRDQYMDSFDTVYPSHSTFPVKSEIIPRLIDGVERLMRGEVAPTASDFMGTPILEYDIGAATILYDHDILFPKKRGS